MALSSAIYGLSGPVLLEAERRFFREAAPYGFIFFARNCETPEQIRTLVRGLHECCGREVLPILIDQEGGRVARLKPPHWPKYPPAGTFASLYAHDPNQAVSAAYLNARLIAEDLSSLGITVNCAPLADVPVPGAHDIIGDRAFGAEPKQVIALARAMADGLMHGGVVPILKHIPGHGRAFCDSHEELPVVREPLEVLRMTDFVPFKALADLPMAMTAHVLYTAIDPSRLATISPAAIRLIREEISFGGLLMSDDLSMKAMQGGFRQRAEETLAAGCDMVLHCNGDMNEMRAVAEGVRPLTAESLARAERALAGIGQRKAFDVAAARDRVQALLAA
jgi:beta-N-acetylhexosaminidase